MIEFAFGALLAGALVWIVRGERELRRATRPLRDLDSTHVARAFRRER